MAEPISEYMAVAEYGTHVRTHIKGRAKCQNTWQRICQCVARVQVMPEDMSEQGRQNTFQNMSQLYMVDGMSEHCGTCHAGLSGSSVTTCALPSSKSPVMVGVT